jgi:SnoaL-like domain
MQEDMQQQLQELLDKKACEEVILRYGRTLDWLDGEGQAACYWPDAEIDYGFFEGAGKDWVPTVMEVESAAPRRWHVSTGVMVQVDGNKAKSECYGISVGSSAGEDGTLTDTMFGGRYLDELEKRDGEWRISTRVYIADWIQHFPNGLEALAESGFTLKVLQIAEAGHELYREM